MDTYELLNLYPHNIRTCEKVKIELCNTYGIDYNKYKILDSNLPLETDGKLHPIFTMCNENMI